MCALFGFLDYGKRVPWHILQKLLRVLANASEVRGHHASGIAYNREDALTIFKRPKPAHKLHFRIPQGISTVGRASTSISSVPRSCRSGLCSRSQRRAI